MNTNQLIDLLRKGDPTGEKPVVVYDPADDFFFAVTDMHVGPAGDVQLVIGDLDDAITSTPSGYAS